MTGPWNSPSPEFAEAAHPELENIHYAEKTDVLKDEKVTRRLSRELVIAILVVVAAVTLLLILLNVV